MRYRIYQLLHIDFLPDFNFRYSLISHISDMVKSVKCLCSALHLYEKNNVGAENEEVCKVMILFLFFALTDFMSVATICRNTRILISF